jgi:hypothetical protein
MAHLLVPSDITVLENKLRIKGRKLSLMETVGLWTFAPMIHFSYSKMDSRDMYHILRNKFDTNASDPAVKICIARQNAVSRKVVAHPFLFVGGAIGAGLPWWSFRKYNYQSKLILCPFLGYFGTWVGRCVGNGIAGRWSEFERDRILGDLPARTYLKAPAAE